MEDTKQKLPDGKPTLAQEAELHEVEMRRAKQRAGADKPPADMPVSSSRTPPD